MKENDRYRVNKPNVILEDFGDEVVIVNLASGNYYSVDAMGAEIWARVQEGAAASEITAQLSREYDGSIVIIEQAVMRFIHEILSENLIVPDAAASAQSPKLDNPGLQMRKPFTSPELHKYTDMQELLLVDPIHEVDETGWPNIADPVSGPNSESKE
jgi:hypothetical protein